MKLLQKGRRKTVKGKRPTATDIEEDIMETNEMETDKIEDTSCIEITAMDPKLDSSEAAPKNYYRNCT